MTGLFRSLTVAAAALTFGATIALTAPAALARDFRSADIHPADYPTVEAVKQMGKALSEQTNGKLGIRVFASGALGTEKDTIEQLRLGGLDMMRINVGALNSVVPETIVTVLPFIFRDTKHMRTVLDGPVGDDILKSMENQGLIGLAFYDSGARSFYTVKKPITSLADFKGLKIRVQPSELFVGMMTALGANATPMPYGEVYTALKTGIVDGAENNWPSYESSRHFEAAKYYSLTEHSLAPEVVVFSKVVWDKLSKDDQALIRKAAKDSVPFMRKLWDEREIKSRKMVEDGGAQITQIANKQELIDAMKPVYAKFADTPALQSLVTRIQDTK
ncbi:TRAP transporter substrate-binding protein [Azospirillum doebereinerae]|uniref:TRAP transporter substrate-binding protein n=1 Tax=Azospirillum doebereinerae TaxID=92933 RepID=A0A3S0WM64_9PROT|nr:TRAP transporter substrate-binding protein [Azospirillum doebereinerae]MCG5241532.1 TRAP transporter substrate-binding protein [Azospirillum doebereinerae]RUQ71457.1 TRAP transporter substrate-binding protein [Azospirillum doebereinerae]